MERLTQRQRALLDLLRAPAESRLEGEASVWRSPVEVERVARLMDYRYPAEACDRLVARGLAVKVAPGLYRARVIRERQVALAHDVS